MSKSTPPKKSPKKRSERLSPAEVQESNELEAYQKHLNQEKEDMEVAVDSLAGVPISSVALIAATLLRENAPAEDAVVKAYEILEWVTFGQNYLRRKMHSQWLKTTGVIEAIRSQEPPADPPDKEIDRWERKFQSQRIEEDAAKTYELNAALKQIIPKPAKMTEKLPLFRKWLMACLKISDMKAGSLIGNWQETGLPSKVFSSAITSYPEWRESNKREGASERAIASHARRKTEKADNALNQASKRINKVDTLKKKKGVQK